MRIVITASGDDLKAPLDSRFGRAPKSTIYDLEQNTFPVIDNSAAGAKVYTCPAATGAAALQEFRNGKLRPKADADFADHWK
jgi:predicted Fe-Mo cluster-binding NifX family protein